MIPLQSKNITKAEGFTDIHSVSGTIIADDIKGGAKLATSSSPIQATFTFLNNIVECETLNGNIQLLLPENTGMKIDGISKRGKIFLSKKNQEMYKTLLESWEKNHSRT